MPNISAKEARKRRRRRRRRLGEKRKCQFCPGGCSSSPRPVYVDYKDVATLRSMTDRNGRIVPRRKTGNCGKYQRAVRVAILRARFMGLLPYVVGD